MWMGWEIRQRANARAGFCAPARSCLKEVEEGVAAAARRSGGAAGGSPSLTRELAGALPIAATAPSRAVLAALTATHVARSLANIAQVHIGRVLLCFGQLLRPSCVRVSAACGEEWREARFAI